MSIAALLFAHAIVFCIFAAIGYAAHWLTISKPVPPHQIECPMCGESEATQNEWTSWIEDLDGWRMARKCCACSHRWRWE